MEHVNHVWKVNVSIERLMVHLLCNLFQAVPATVTAVAINQHVILLLEHAIIAIVIIAMTLKKDGCIKNVEIIANCVYRMDCVLTELKQVKNILIYIFF